MEALGLLGSNGPMNDRFLFSSTLFATIGAGIIAGLFFTFSVVVMRSLDRLPAAQGIAAMQSINKVIINPLFMLFFMGTAVVSVGLGIVGALRLDRPEGKWLLAGAALYLVGSFVLTMAYNVPRNDRLDGFDPTTAEAARYWATYVTEWTMANHVRTIASIGSLASYVMALRVG
jgi:uncharacterized membrane protein